MKTQRITTDEQREAALNLQQSLAPVPTAPIVETTDPAAMLTLAISKGVDAGSIQQLVDLYRQLEADRAKREFASALLAFQNDCPIIVKNRTANAGSYKYDFASLDSLATTIRPHLNQHGLSYTFDGAVANDSVKVTTIVRHIGGHEERTTFEAPVDKGSKMNVMQQVASATSYARRYGLLMAFGLATGDDDDGHGTSPQFIDDDEYQRVVDLIAESKADPVKFAGVMGVESLRMILKRDYNRAISALQAKKRENERKAADAAEKAKAATATNGGAA